MKKSGEYSCISKKTSVSAKDLGTSAQLLECFDAILNYNIDYITQRMKLFFPKAKSEYELRVVDKLLRECYKDIAPKDYIRIISSIVEDIPSDLLKMIHYEELCEELIGQYNKTRLLTKTQEILLDDYTSKIVALNINNKSSVIIDYGMKHRAYSLRLNYCKYKNDLKETIEVSLKLMEYAANSTQMGEDLYGLLIALYSIETVHLKIISLLV